MGQPCWLGPGLGHRQCSPLPYSMSPMVLVDLGECNILHCLLSWMYIRTYMCLISARLSADDYVIRLLVSLINPNKTGKSRDERRKLEQRNNQCSLSRFTRPPSVLPGWKVGRNSPRFSRPLAELVYLVQNSSNAATPSLNSFSEALRQPENR